MNIKPACRLFLVRHGEVDAPKGVYYGHLDVPLSNKGIELTLKTCEYLSKFSIDKIFSSDLSRCALLANHLKSLKKETLLELDEDLREINFGDWTGLTADQIEEKYPGCLMKRYSDLANYCPPNGENLLLLQKRVIPFILKAKKYQNSVIVTHAGVIRSILIHLLNLDFSYFFKIDISYCGISIIDFFEDDIFVLKKINFTVYDDLN